MAVDNQRVSHTAFGEVLCKGRRWGALILGASGSMGSHVCGFKIYDDLSALLERIAEQLGGHRSGG